MTTVNVTQDVLEVVYVEPVPVKVTQDVVEVLYFEPIPVSVTQDVVELIWKETATPGSVVYTGNVPTIGTNIFLATTSGGYVYTGNIPALAKISPFEGGEYNPRCVLVEIEYATSEQQIFTEYLSNLGYTTGAGDNPASTHYSDIIIDSPVITSRVDSQLQVGRLTIRNRIREFDADSPFDLVDWITRSWHGQNVRLFIGDPSWSRGQFKKFFSGKVESFSMDGDGTLVFTVADAGILLRDTVTKTYGFYGKVFNMSPVYVGEGQSDTYEIDDISNDNVFNISQVRDNGSVVNFTPNDNSTRFELDIPPAGAVTVDAIRSENISAGEVIKRIITDMGFTTDIIDLDSMAQAITGVGYVIKKGETLDYMRIIQDIATSAGGYVQWGASGKLEFYYLSAQTPAVMHIDVDDITSGGVRITSIDDPLMYLKLGYNRNWTVQDYSNLAGIAQVDSSPYTVEYEYITQDLGKTVQYPIPMNVIADTLIAEKKSAQAEFDRRMSQRSAPSMNLSFDCFNLFYNLKLGNNINVTYPRLGFNNKKCCVVGIELNPNTNITSLNLWIPGRLLSTFSYQDVPQFGATISFSVDISSIDDDIDLTTMARALGFASPELEVGDTIPNGSLIQVALGNNAFDGNESTQTFIDENIVRMNHDGNVYTGLFNNTYSTMTISAIDIENKKITGSFTTTANYLWSPGNINEPFYTIPAPGYWIEPEHIYRYSEINHESNWDEYGPDGWNMDEYELFPDNTTLHFTNNGSTNYIRVGSRIRVETGGMSHRVYFRYIDADGNYKWASCGIYQHDDGSNLPEYRGYL